MGNELNPYEAPGYSGGKQKANTSPRRNIARSNLRMALVILLIPAVYNYYWFDVALLASEDRQFNSVFLVFARAINIGGIFIASLFAWFFGLPILELTAKIIYRIFARNSKIDDWQDALYDILGTVAYFALGGALLWLIWTIGFYRFHIGFYTLAYPVGILAHLLAAGLYLRLAYRWYRIEKTAQVPESINQR